MSQHHANNALAAMTDDMAKHANGVGKAIAWYAGEPVSEATVLWHVVDHIAYRGEDHVTYDRLANGEVAVSLLSQEGMVLYEFRGYRVSAPRPMPVLL
jgi:hypothetical protein